MRPIGARSSGVLRHITDSKALFVRRHSSRCVRTVAWKEANMRYKMLLRIFPLVPSLLLGLLVTAAAQDIRFLPDFNSPQSSRLQLNDGATLAEWNAHTVLRLIDGSPNPESRTAYFNVRQNVAMGFTTYFAFQMHTPFNGNAPGDGFAFILQNSTATDSTQGASGSGLHAVGSEDGGLGYSGINNSMAVEFDIFEDPWDPTSNHIAVQTCGGNFSVFNSPVHLPGTYTIGNNHDVTSCLLSSGAINSNINPLGPICNMSGCTNGAVHQVVVEYDPPANILQPGTLLVYLDPTFIPGSLVPIPGSQPTISVPYNIIYTQSNPLGLNLAGTSNLYVGFGASQPAAGGDMRAPDSASGGTAIDVLAWEFTSHAPITIKHTIPQGGVENDFVFGGHVFAVTYPKDYVNDTGLSMSVEATPVNQQTFDTNRLQGTNFADETCIIYGQTGGNCVDYSVTCQNQSGQMVICPPEPMDNIAICSEFYTAQEVAIKGTDFLKADPIGSNNWCSIWTGFNNGIMPPIDPIVSGKGPGMSDFVATLSPTGPGMPTCGGTLDEVTNRLTQVVQTASGIGPTPPHNNGFCPAIGPTPKGK